MGKVHKPRAGSGCAITSVSASVEWIQKMNDLKIRPSDAFKRGLKFYFDEAEGKPTPDEAQRKLDKWMKLANALQDEVNMLKHMRGE